MSTIDYLQNQLTELTRLLHEYDELIVEEWSPEWMSRESVRARLVSVNRELEIAQGDFQLELRLRGQRVVDNAVDLVFLGQLAELFQGVASAVGDVILHGPGRLTRDRVPADVLEATAMLLVGTAPGSFVLGLEGPRSRERQLAFEEDDPQRSVPVFDEAIARIFDVLDAAENDVSGERLTDVISELGGHKALQNMSKFVTHVYSNGMAVDVVDRSPFRDQARQTGLTAASARRLGVTLSRTTQTSQIIEVRGRLSGVRWRRGVFDVEVPDEGKTYTGKIALELRDRVRNLFDRDGVFTLELLETRA